MSAKMDKSAQQRKAAEEKKAAAGGGKGSNEKKFTRGQVAQHRSMNDCWVIIHNKVYNVTPYITDHPGGSTVFLEWSGTGKDAGQEFELAGHGKKAKNIMNKYYVGVINS